MQLRKSDVDLNSQDSLGCTALHIAAIYNCVNVARLLLEHNADVTINDNKGQNAFNKAAQEGNFEIIQLLIELNRDNLPSLLQNADTENNSNLHLAVNAGSHKTVKILFEECEAADIVDKRNIHGECPMHAAVRSGNLDLVKLLSSNGACINTRNSNYETPLHVVADTSKCGVNSEHDVCQSYEITEYLIERYFEQFGKFLSKDF